MKTFVLVLAFVWASQAEAKKVRRDFIPSELEAEVWMYKACGGFRFKLLDLVYLDDWKIVTFTCLGDRK